MLKSWKKHIVELLLVCRFFVEFSDKTLFRTKYEAICTQLDVYQQEAHQYYQQVQYELLNSMERKRNDASPYNFTIMEEYISGIREIYLMFRKEYFRYQSLFNDQLNYLDLTHDQIKDLYRKFATHQFIKINKGKSLKSIV